MNSFFLASFIISVVFFFLWFNDKKAGVYSNPKRFYRNFILNYLFFIGVAALVSFGGTEIDYLVKFIVLATGGTYIIRKLMKIGKK